MNFFVVFGYCGPDHYTSKDNTPLLEVRVFKKESEVAKHYREFMEEHGDLDSSQVTYRIIEGRERGIKPVVKVTEYKLT